MPIVFKAKLAKVENLSAILTEVKRTHETQVQRDLSAYFYLVTGTWKHKPKISARTALMPNQIVTAVRPTGENEKIWTFVTLGTKPHPIKPRRAKFLRFMWGGPGSYVPKTRPPAQYGGPGVVKNGTMQYRKSVKHPGSKGRFFEKKIMKEYRPKYRILMREAIKRGVRIAKANRKTP